MSSMNLSFAFGTAAAAGNSDGDSTDDDMPPLVATTSTPTPPRKRTAVSFDSTTATSNDGDSTDEDMPPLMATDSNNSASPRRRIVRAIRPPTGEATPEGEKDERDSEEQESEDEDEDSEDEEEDSEDEDEDSEDEEEDSDDENYYQGEMEIPPPIRDFFRALGGGDDDDDDDDGPCDCPQCRMRMMSQFLGMMHSHTGNDSDDEEEEEDSEEEEEDSEDDDADDSFLYTNAPTCAICLEPENRRRSLVVLPCCGGENEATSSTRFCRACVHKCLRRSNNNSGLPVATTRAVGECPRCKHLLLLLNKEEKTVSKASVLDKIRFIARKSDGDYRIFLLTAAWCHAEYLPVELLTFSPMERMSEDKLLHMVQWGLLDKKSDTMYRINPVAQNALRNWCAQFLEANFDGDMKMVRFTDNIKSNRNQQCFLTSCVCFSSGWRAAWNSYRVWRCLRLWNRGLTLLLVATGRFLPNFQQWSKHAHIDGCLTTVLNLFVVYLLCKILLQALYVVMYLAMGYVVSFAVGKLLVYSPANRWGKLVCIVSGIGLVLYFSYETYLLYLGLEKPRVRNYSRMMTQGTRIIIDAMLGSSTTAHGETSMGT